jgi:hypothetical protein
MISIPTKNVTPEFEINSLTDIELILINDSSTVSDANMINFQNYFRQLKSIHIWHVNINQNKIIKIWFEF